MLLACCNFLVLDESWELLTPTQSVLQLHRKMMLTNIKTLTHAVARIFLRIPTH